MAAAALAACSNDETIASQATSDANAISFRPLMNKMTRAADVTETTLHSTGFKVFANIYAATTEGANYMPETQFSWVSSSSTYNSESKYYWPSSAALNFYAWAANQTEQISHTATTKVFVVTPAALSSASSASGQTDLVIANTNNKSKDGEYDPSNPYSSGTGAKYGANGVPLNFRHAESKVIIQLKNTNSNLKFTIKDVAIGNVYGRGTYTYPGGNDTGTSTDGNNEATLSGGWGSQDTKTSYSFTMSSSESYNVLDGVVGAKYIPNSTAANYEMILIPQTLTAATAYNGDVLYVENVSTASTFDGAYITVQLKIQRAGTDTYIVGEAGDNGYVTAMWPLQADTWAPGMKYTYTVDLAGGGYYDVNTVGDSKLDPILEGAEIKFVTCTVDSWTDGPTVLLANVIKGSTSTFNEAKTAAGTYNIVVSGLTSGNTVSVNASDNNLASISVSPATVPTSGIVTITATLAANETNEAVTSTITLTKGSTASVTTIKVVQAGS